MLGLDVSNGEEMNLSKMREPVEYGEYSTEKI